MYCQMMKLKQFSNKFNAFLEGKTVSGLASTAPHEQWGKLPERFGAGVSSVKNQRRQPGSRA